MTKKDQQRSSNKYNVHVSHVQADVDLLHALYSSIKNKCAHTCTSVRVSHGSSTFAHRATNEAPTSDATSINRDDESVHLQVQLGCPVKVKRSSWCHR